MKRFRIALTALTILLSANLIRAFTPSGLLEIHYINVGTAGCTLLIGPDGTTILMDGGNNGNGYADIIPYLQSIGLTPADDLDYMLSSHLDSDHCGGLDEVINGGYDVLEAVYYNGSDKWNTIVEDFFNAAATTTAGGPDAIPLGTVIPLGDGATATCVAVHGQILGDGSVSVPEENDRGGVLLVQYGEFEYLFGGDLGGGDDDEWCTGRHTATNYANVETPLSTSLISPSGANLLGPDGLEVLHVNHHGSEGSTNNDYMDNLKPSVACISVGWGQSDGWDFPRHDVVDNVLRSEASACVDADPAIVFQTEDGSGSPDTYRSYTGYAIGDIIIKTNGQRLFQVSGSGRLHGGPDERTAAGLPRYFPLDEDTGDLTAPSAITDLAATGGPGSDEITLSWTAPGDDGTSDTAAVYDIRYRAAAYGPINNESAWEEAIGVGNTPSPQPAGTAENLTISGLSSGQSYYFAVKTMDDNLNLSSLSNSPIGTAGPIGDQPPYIASVYRYPYSVVYPEDDVAVRAEITDDGSITKDSLYYQGSSLLTYIAVGHDSIGTDNSNYYWYTIPAAAAGTLIEYYVIAEDDSAQRVESSMMSYSVSEHPISSLVNGDFELWNVNGPGGPPDNWTEDTGGFTASREESVVHGGNYSANLTWTSTQTQILNSDPIDVTGGVAYPCSVYVYDNDLAGRFRLCFISDDGNSYPENYSTDQDSWQHLGYTWIAPANATWVVVQLRMYDVSTYWNGSATVYADDVVFVDTTSSSPELTIHDIQFNNSLPGAGCYDSPYLGQTVSISGTVVAIEQGTNPNYYIQDCSVSPWNGIYAFDNTQTLELGENVTVSAQVDEYFGMTELSYVTSLTSNSTGNAICTTLVTSDDISPSCNPVSEAYEGMLVRLNNVTCVVEPDQYGVGYLKSSGAADSCAFDDELHIDGSNHPVAFAQGQTYAYVIGVVHYSYDEYKINPRFSSDVVLAGEGVAYVPGDANMATGQWPPQVIGSDVTYLVNYFRGLNMSCMLGGQGFYCAADANGDCQVIGSDVTKLVSYFRGVSGLSYCADYEPLWLTPADCPPEAPAGWPNCESPVPMIKDIPPGQSR